MRVGSDSPMRILATSIMFIASTLILLFSNKNSGVMVGLVLGVIFLILFFVDFVCMSKKKSE